MFSKEDYAKYFREIMKIEARMASGFLRCSERSDDPEIKEFFRRLYREEVSHGDIAASMWKIFSDDKAGAEGPAGTDGR